jgi:hypothetical protein
MSMRFKIYERQRLHASFRAGGDEAGISAIHSWSHCVPQIKEGFR